jgi:hypothetical protein
LPSEVEADYVWALQQFSEIVSIKVIVTDGELALMNTIPFVFPGCQNILCIWHINKKTARQVR